jgi:flagellar hook assembly protein FlgD
LQNQSPLDPVDPDQMTTELVQFNMLDQLTQINQTLSGALNLPTQTGGH